MASVFMSRFLLPEGDCPKHRYWASFGHLLGVVQSVNRWLILVRLHAPDEAENRALVGGSGPSVEDVDSTAGGFLDPDVTGQGHVVGQSLDVDLDVAAYPIRHFPVQG